MSSVNPEVGLALRREFCGPEPDRLHRLREVAAWENAKSPNAASDARSLCRFAASGGFVKSFEERQKRGNGEGTISFAYKCHSTTHPPEMSSMPQSPVDA